MTIAETREKCKNVVAMIPRDMLVIMVIILASSASFGLGFLAGIDVGQGSGTAIVPPSPIPSSQGQVVVSKTGTKYYFLSCAGANRISEANKTWFTSAEVAEHAGYTLATNCKAP